VEACVSNDGAPRREAGWTCPTLPDAVVVTAAPIALVLIADRYLASSEPSRLVLGLLDETAHLATAVVAVAATGAVAGRALPRDWVAAVLAASVLVDLDHVPADLLGSNVLMGSLPRPYTHSAATVLVLLLAAALTRGRRRRVSAGAAAGVVLHLWRDLATGPGVPALWPLAPYVVVQTPYRSVYLASLVLAGAGAVAVVGRRQQRSVVS
jgi:inner membrane protein